MPRKRGSRGGRRRSATATPMAAVPPARPPIIDAPLPLTDEELYEEDELFVEIGAGQGCDVLELARHYFSGATVEIAKDYANRDRLLFVQYPW